MSPRAGSLSNEPLAVPGESISSDSFLSSSQAGFPLQDWGRARKGSVALVDDRRRCNCVCVRVRVCVCVCFTILERMFFNRFLWSSKSIHPSTLPSDLSQRTSSLYLILKDSHPQKESSRRSQQLHVSLRGPVGPGDNSCFAPKEPSPRALRLRSARAPTRPRRPSSCLPLPARRVRDSLGLSLALAAPISGPPAP